MFYIFYAKYKFLISATEHKELIMWNIEDYQRV